MTGSLWFQLSDMRIHYIANVRMPTEKAHGIQIAKMCEAFAAKGVDVTLIVPARKTPISEDVYAYHGVERTFKIVKLPTLDTVGLGRIGFLFQTALFSLVALLYILCKRQDAIFSRDEIPAALISLFKKRVIWESHDGRMNIFVRTLISQGTQIITTTRAAEHLYRETGPSPERIVVEPNAISLEDFEVSEEAVAAARKQMAPSDRKIVLYAGRLDGWKGAETFLAAAALLEREVMSVVIGGEPSQVAVLSKRYPNTRFLGYIPYKEIAAYQRAADVLVLPNTAKNEIAVKYTSPLKLFTYMAAARPIVSSDLETARSILNESECVFFEPDNPEACAVAIRSILAHPKEAEERALRARAKVESYTWEARAGRILGALG